MHSPEVTRDAGSADRKENIKIGSREYGAGVILNADPGRGGITNSVEYDLVFSQSGAYEIWVEYAADDPRPCQVLWKQASTSQPWINVGNDYELNRKTGGWEEQWQKWEHVGNVTARHHDKYTLRIARPGNPFPHIRRIGYTFVG